MSGVLITRLFGVFLIVWALMELPRSVYVTMQGYEGRWLGVVLLGVLPFILPIVFGAVIARFPTVLFRDSGERSGGGAKALATIALALMGLFLLVDGFLDLVFQIGLALLSEEGRFFHDSEAAANTIASLVELHSGIAIVLSAKKFAAWIVGATIE